MERTGKEVLSKVGEGGGFGFESGDGFDEASDGEGIANTARAADEAEDAAFTSELDRDAHESGDAGAVNLRNAVEDDHDFFGAGLDDGFKGVMELLGGLADGQPALNFQYGRTGRLADVDFHGQAVSHGRISLYP